MTRYSNTAYYRQDQYVELDIVEEIHRTNAAILVKIENPDTCAEEETKNIWIPLSQVQRNVSGSSVSIIHKSGERTYMYISRFIANKLGLV